MRSITKYLSIIFLFLSFLILFDLYGDGYKSIENFSSSIGIKSLSFCFLKENPILKDNLLHENPSEAQRIWRNILYFISSHPDYNFPSLILINKKIITNYVKDYSLFLLAGESSYKPAPEFVIAVNSKRIYRFGKVEYEKERLSFGLKIKKIDIVNFNKIMRQEGNRIKEAQEGLDLCLLFIKMSYSIDEEIVSSEETIKSHFYKFYGQKEAIDKINSFGGKMFLPKVKIEKSKSYKYIFQSVGYGTIKEWKINVSKRGKIDVISCEEVI